MQIVVHRITASGEDGFCLNKTRSHFLRDKPMTVKTLSAGTPTREHSKFKALRLAVWRRRWLYLLIAPSVIYFIIFKYGPLWNAQIAFRDFKPLLGILGSPFVALENFQTFINSYYFTELLTNTIFFSIRS